MDGFLCCVYCLSLPIVPNCGIITGYSKQNGCRRHLAFASFKRARSARTDRRLGADALTADGLLHQTPEEIPGGGGVLVCWGFCPLFRCTYIWQLIKIYLRC
jgi:hypothetical protein